MIICVDALELKEYSYTPGFCEEVEDAGERGERREEHGGESAGR